MAVIARQTEAEVEHRWNEMAIMPFNSPIIEILPMCQRLEIRDEEEDWTGKSSTSERRKLRNRLNQRAYRRRKLGEKFQKEIPPIDCVAIIQRATELQHERYLGISLQRPSSSGSLHMCMNPFNRRHVVSAPNFESFIKMPLPSDQKLLTLLYFNLVRALTQNVFTLSLNPDDMNSELESPFAFTESRLAFEALPETLRPTELQKTIPHHAELDVFPFPKWRDNMLRRGWTHPKDYYCMAVWRRIGCD
ncbi:hypothetical protein BGZ57DRAFT_926281 [Hyaloscypha finlandica]|nr:hypothetical protein BGZ57DRAFT_926281 [Hyaloscypha finlandica]